MDADVKKCCFCLTSLDDEVLYGKFYELNDIQTHYYCLLLSSNIQQHGKDDEGILGFLMEDIQKEISRGKRLKCSYCHKKGATLFCCKSKCKKIFHLPCGRLNNSLHHFYGEFKSYCFKHRPIQVITSPVLEDSSKSVNECAICFEVVKSWPNIDTLWAPCCSVNSWFHRNCIQKLALSAGYFFKCPLCNNKDYFQVSMLEQGIFIPEQDASWELVPNAFAELLERYEQCDADACLSPKGRKYTSCRTKWEIVLCRLCGSQGTHVQCGNLKTKRRAWECSNCTSMLQSARKDNSISETQPGTISDISEPDGMRSRLLSLNNSLTRGCASSERISSSGESDIGSNIAGQGAARSTRKTIQSNINKSVSFDDDIQVIAVFSPKLQCTEGPKLLTSRRNTSPAVSHFECDSAGSFPKSDINILDELDIKRKHYSSNVNKIVDSDDSRDCVITAYKGLPVDKINNCAKVLDYKSNIATNNAQFEDSPLSVASCQLDLPQANQVDSIVNLLQDSEKKRKSSYNTSKVKMMEEKSRNTLFQTQLVERSTLTSIGYQESSTISICSSDESSCDAFIDVEN